MFLIFHTGRVGRRQNVPQFVGMANSMEEAKKVIQDCRKYEVDNGFDPFQLGVLEVDPKINYMTHGKKGSIYLRDGSWDYLDSGEE